jgi:uncharacterized membrane protein
MIPLILIIILITALLTFYIFFISYTIKSNNYIYKELMQNKKYKDLFEFYEKYAKGEISDDEYLILKNTIEK